MKIYGYEKAKHEIDGEELLELREATIECSLDELKKIILFLEHTLKAHSLVDKTNLCHSHYRDWEKDWSENSPDFIIFTGEAE